MSKGPPHSSPATLAQTLQQAHASGTNPPLHSNSSTEAQGEQVRAHNSDCVPTAEKTTAKLNSNILFIFLK
jgi:hypothetical protein